MSQKRLFSAIMLTIVWLLFVVLLSGCGATDENAHGATNGAIEQNSESHQTEEATPSQPAEEISAVELPEIDIPTAPGTAVAGNDQAVVDFSNMQDGYIMAKYIEDTDMQIRMLITVPDGITYTYTLIPGRDFEVFPLSGGDGTYEIGVYKQAEDGRYSTVLTTTIDVELVDEFAPFLRPNQFVNFDRYSDVVRKAAELTYGLEADDFMGRVEAIYQFVVSNIEYDIELAETVQTGYIPDVDEVLRRGKGICFDYAALMTAMLRSQGVPTKLVIGYTGELYHAWISVYSAESGWIDGAIFFDGHDWQLVDPTVAASVSSTSLMDFIGDGTNYTAKFFH